MTFLGLFGCTRSCKVLADLSTELGLFMDRGDAVVLKMKVKAVQAKLGLPLMEDEPLPWDRKPPGSEGDEQQKEEEDEEDEGSKRSRRKRLRRKAPYSSSEWFRRSKGTAFRPKRARKPAVVGV